jgi:vacuolar-type H+-ATPase subunit H
MKVLDLMDTLEDLIENSSSVPLFGKTVINREEVMKILKDIRVTIPDEVKQAKWIKDERGKILNDAQQEADRIVRSAHSEANAIVAEAQDRVEKLVQKDEIMRQARIKGQELVDQAKQHAGEIRKGAYSYADEVMSKVELSLEKHYDSVKRSRIELEKYQQKSHE